MSDIREARKLVEMLKALGFPESTLETHIACLSKLERIVQICENCVRSEFLEAPGDMKEVCTIVGVDPYGD